MEPVVYKWLNPEKGNAPSEEWEDDDLTLGVLYNGAVVFQMKDSSNDMSFYVDVNGSKGPNQYGYDYFIFFLYFQEGRVNLISETACDKSSTDSPGLGFGCAARVIKNIDY
ncbi:MAG: hypothetical protein ACOC2M_04765 [bacterium]